VDSENAGIKKILRRLSSSPLSDLWRVHTVAGYSVPVSTPELPTAKMSTRLRKCVFGQRPLVPFLLLLGPPFFPITRFGPPPCFTRMTGISLHMQWPLTSQLHGSVSKRKQLVDYKNVFQHDSVSIIETQLTAHRRC
jgi:hypothetical protein